MSYDSVKGIRRWRRITTLAAVLCCAIALAGCGGSTPKAGSADEKAGPAPQSLKTQTVRTRSGKVKMEPDISVRERRELHKEGKL